MLRPRQSNLAGVLGWPLEHTLSPTIHNAAFRRLGLDWVYLAFPVPPESLEAAVAGLRALGARGANVTMPHKETVLPFLDSLTEEAASLGAVNTIENLAGRLVGHNTDVEGFTRFLQDDAGADVQGRSALMLGAGGAARAVGRALSDLGIGSLQVAARDLTRSEGLAEVVPGVEGIGWERAARAAGEADVIVNCTPVGAAGEDLLPDAVFRPGQVVIDLLYRPPKTPLQERARAAGAEAWGGLGMLVHQAAASFRIWTGQEPPLDVMSVAAVHSLGGGVLHKEQ